MRSHTARPVVTGTFGVVTSSHWLASSAGMAVLEDGGNAFDAAVAAGFVLQVVEPHMHGPAGEVTAIFSLGRDPHPRVLCGQGVAPEKASIDYFVGDLSLREIPSMGLLAAVVPGVWDAWLLLLAEYGTKRLHDVLKYAIYYARHGFPMAAPMISQAAQTFRNHWPTSAALWLQNGQVPKLGHRFSNPMLASTFERLLAEAESVGPDRERQIDAGRNAWSNGFVAEAIDAFCQTPSWDSSGVKHSGLLCGQDMASWRASFEESVTVDLGELAEGYSLAKCGFWSQGPVLAQQLQLLGGYADQLSFKKVDGLGLGGRAHMVPDAETIHLAIESAKLAFADRDAWYGDEPDVPVEDLFSQVYATERRTLISDSASLDLRPGSPGGRKPRLPTAIESHQALIGNRTAVPPSMRGDTVHLDVVDRWGNMLSATPSGGWLQSSPTIESLGFSLGVRAEMFWLEDGLPNSLRPGKRPRTTLSPSLGMYQGEPTLAFGTPGGDQQDQWQICFWLAHVIGGMNLQEAVDTPMWHTNAVLSSYNPRAWQPGEVVVESRLDAETISNLEERGHVLLVGGPWGHARPMAVSRDVEDRLLRGSATSRGMKTYAVGR